MSVTKKETLRCLDDEKLEALREAYWLITLIARETYDTAIEKKAKDWLERHRACVYQLRTGSW